MTEPRNPSKRLNYFDHQFLTVDDFRDEQEYHLGQQQRHNRLLHTPGIATGLEVTQRAGEKSVTVAPGTAIDSLGREIVLTAGRSLDLTNQPAGKLVVTIAYGETESDPATQGDVKANRRVLEQPSIVARPETEQFDTGINLILAGVERDNSSALTMASVRRLAGAGGSAASLLELTFRDDVLATKDWARMRLESAGRVNLTGSLHIAADATGTTTKASGMLTVDGVLDARGITAPTGNISQLTAGDLTVTGGATVGKSLVVGGIAQLKSDLAVDGATTLVGLTTKGAVQISPPTGMKTALSVTSGVASLQAGLVVSAGATIAGGLTVTGGLASLQGGLAVTSGATIAGGLTVTGALASLQGGLAVTSGATIGGGLTVTGAVTQLSAGLSVSGGTTALTSGVTVTGALANLNSGLQVTGPATFNGGLQVATGAVIFSSGVNIQGGGLTLSAGVAVTGNVIVNQGLTVTGIATFNGLLNTNAALNANAALTVAGVLNANGAAAFTKGMTITGGNVGIGQQLPVTALHVEGNEIHSGGSTGGFSFASRETAAFIQNPGTTGQRWTWYAAGGAARLWSGRDLVTVNPAGGLFANGSITASGGGVVAFGNSVINGNLQVTGAFFCPAKQGYVVDQFVNNVGDTLEQGDVVVIGDNGSVARYADQQVPVSEVDLTDRACDTRVCGIVESVHGELVDVPADRQAKTKRHKTTRLFDEEELEKIDRTKIPAGQVGSYVTLGAFAVCKVDAGFAPIVAGDLLTTSPTKGHAQKVLDPSKATGAIIGKALAGLAKGTDKIPVFVSLQ